MCDLRAHATCMHVIAWQEGNWAAKCDSANEDQQVAQRQTVSGGSTQQRSVGIRNNLAAAQRPATVGAILAGQRLSSFAVFGGDGLVVCVAICVAVGMPIGMAAHLSLEEQKGCRLSSLPQRLLTSLRCVQSTTTLAAYLLLLLALQRCLCGDTAQRLQGLPLAADNVLPGLGQCDAGWQRNISHECS